MGSKPQQQSLMPNACECCQARHDGICAVLDSAELERLAQHSRHTSHDAGETLAVEGDEIDAYASVLTGVVKLSRVLHDGRQQLVGLQFPNDLVGRLFGTTSPLTVEAASDVALCRFPRSVLETLVGSSAELKLRLLDRSLRELDEAREWMITLGRKDAAERVATLLLLIATRNRPSGSETENTVSFELPISRGDIADFLGLTIETVSRQFSRLRHDRIIVVSGRRHVTVADLQRLRNRAG